MTLVSDGTDSFEGGQRDRKSNSQVAPNQYLRGINVKTGNDVLSPRPGFIQKRVTVTTRGGAGNLSYQTIYTKGKFQSACAYEAEDGEFILTVRSGIMFKVDPVRLTAEVVQFADSTDRMNQYRRRIPRTHAGRFVAFFDYPNVPAIVEDMTIRRADQTKYEIPSSVLGGYVSNRLWVANRGHSFAAGDPTGSIDDAPITFEEILAPAAAYLGQSFTLGSQSAKQQITALGFLQTPDLPNGVGPLFIATANSVNAGRTDIPREQWENSTFTRNILFNGGMSGPRAFANVNTDVIFLGGDNQVRSLLLSQTEQGRWSNAPISLEVNNWLKEHERQDLLDIAFVSCFKNRVFIGVGPYATEAYNLSGQKVFDYAHAGMIVLEMNNASGLGEQAAPAWAGLWTGVYPMEMVTLSNAAYIFSKDDGGINQMYLMDDNSSVDIADDVEVPITCRLYTRNYDFKSVLSKKLGNVTYVMSQVEGQLNMKVEYKPKHAESWALWKCFTHDAPTDFESFDSAGEMPVLDPHTFKELNLGDPDQMGIDGVSGDQYQAFRSVGLRITLSAKNWSLEQIKLFAETLETNAAELVEFDEPEPKELIHKFGQSDWDIHSTAPRGNLWL